MNLCVFIIYFQKIERLKGELHLLDADSKQKNKHTFFVDSKKEGKYNVQQMVIKTSLSLWA